MIVLRAITRGFGNFRDITGPMGGFVLGLMIFVPALLFESMELSFWLGLLAGTALCTLVLLSFSVKRED